MEAPKKVICVGVDNASKHLGSIDGGEFGMQEAGVLATMAEEESHLRLVLACSTGIGRVGGGVNLVLWHKTP